MKGRHTKKKRSRRVLRVLLPVAIGLTLLGGGVAYAAYRYEEANQGKILPGVTLGGVEVGGMSRDEALEAVSEAADERLDQEIEVTAADGSWHVSPHELGMDARVEPGVDAALALSDSIPWYERAYRRLLDRSVAGAVDLSYSVDRSEARSFIDVVAGSVYASPRNAAVALTDDGELMLRRPVRGAELRSREARRALASAIRAGEETVQLPMRTTPPEVTAESLGKTIVVSLTENRLYLYDGLKVQKRYDVATGTGGYPTPPGTWTIWDKREDPIWINPAPDGWGKDLPASIGPGPGNPLGTHALYLDAPGIRIHGTYAEYSIGTYASHGCVRMRIEDSQDLYDRVPIGTHVLIHW